MTAAEFRNEALERAGLAASDPALPVVRIRKNAAVGIVVLPPDAKRRVVVSIRNIRTVVYIGGIDLIARGRTVILAGERHMVTGVFGLDDGDIEIETTFKGKTHTYPASAITGVPK